MNSQAQTLPATGAPDARPKARLGSLRALWPFVRAHMGLFVSWLVALAMASAATLSLPYAFKQMIDQGFSSGANIDRAFLGLFGVAVVLALASAARFYFVSLLGERVVADLRRQLYAHLLAWTRSSTTAPAAASWSRACRPTRNCCAAWSAARCRWRCAARSR